MTPDKNSSITNMSKEEVLYHLLKKEHGYYKAIFEITRQENEKLNLNQSILDIKPLLKKKKILLSCISEIENALTPLKKYWQSKTDRSDFFSELIKQELEGLNKLLKEILQMDLLSQKTLENHMITIRAKGKEPLNAPGQNPKPTN